MHQHVEALDVDPVDQSGQGRVVGQVDRADKDCGLRLFFQGERQLLKVVDGAGQQDEVVVPCQVPGHGQADPGGRSGDQGDRAALVAAGACTGEAVSGGEGGGLPLSTTSARLGGRGVDLGDLWAHLPSLRKTAAPGSPGTE